MIVCLTFSGPWFYAEAVSCGHSCGRGTRPGFWNLESRRADALRELYKHRALGAIPYEIKGAARAGAVLGGPETLVSPGSLSGACFLLG